MGGHKALQPSELVEALTDRALSVCRHYLPNGRRHGNYWIVGDVRNSPGRSMYVRLASDGHGRKAGRWADAATGEYGDLLDIIRETTSPPDFAATVAEAERFIGEHHTPRWRRFRVERPASLRNVDNAIRLYSKAGSIGGTLGEAYLLNRGIAPAIATGLRFHPRCYCRPETLESPTFWPALVAPVTDQLGALTGLHRIYLSPEPTGDHRQGKAPILDPKRSLGRIHGLAVRFGPPSILAVLAEGIENALSVRTAFPDLTVHAALSAGNLRVYVPLPQTRFLLVALDDDDAGRKSAQVLVERLSPLGISVACLRPRANDHNLDLRTLGLTRYREFLSTQMALADGATGGLGFRDALDSAISNGATARPLMKKAPSRP